MKTKKNLTTGVLIGIGLIVIPLILMGSKSSLLVDENPESHVWELEMVLFTHAINKQVRLENMQIQNQLQEDSMVPIL